MESAQPCHTRVEQDHLAFQGRKRISSVAMDPPISLHRRTTSSVSTPGTFPLEHESDDPPRLSLDHPPPYSSTPGTRGSTLITAVPPTEEHLFQVQELARPAAGSGSGFGPGPMSTQHHYICANPMHDQQYLLIGSGNALHSIDLTLPADKQSIQTHIQGLAFKEIHCLENIGLVVVIAGRNARVRCYDYDAIKSLVSYGHSKEGQGRVVEGGKLGAMKNMIQLRVETALTRDDSHPSDNVNSSPAGQTMASRLFKGSSPSSTPQPTVSSMSSTPSASQLPSHHRHTSSIDRSLLSPTAPTDTNPTMSGTDALEMNHDTSTSKKSKQRPLSFGGLASLAQEHVMKGRSQQPQQTGQPVSSASTPASPGTGSTGNSTSKSKRLSQMATYLSQAAVSTNLAHAQDAPSEEAVSWAWNFTKLKQTKDVMALDFHYTTSTVYMTILSKTGIDIYSRPRSAWGRQAASWSAINPSQARQGGTGSETPCRPGMSTASVGGMVSPFNNSPANSPHLHRDSNSYEWRQYKQFYHPETPSFMTVVKGPQDVTDIILGKGPRACVINVEDMSVTDLHRQETSSVIHGIGKKLGFRNSSLWHSFEKIPFDVPPHILFPAAAEAMYGYRDNKSLYATYGSEQHAGQETGMVYSYPPGSSSDTSRRSRDDILQRPSDQQTMHREQMEEQEEAEANSMALKLQHAQLLGPNTDSYAAGGSPSSSLSSSTSSITSSSNMTHPYTQTTAHTSTAKSKKTRMVTSDEVLNMAFTQRTAGQLFLATYGSQSRIVDLQGKPQSRIVLEWDSFPPQKVEFLKTAEDIYVVGFEKTSIVIYSLTRAKKIKEILKRDLVQAATAVSAMGTIGLGSLGADPCNPPQPLTSTPGGVPGSSATTYVSSSIKFLGRDSIAADSLGIFFSYCHPRNGVSLCKLGIVPVAQDDLELVGYYS
ncbi:hypothetical protein BG011_009409 [Mortierella polycephala]|uniref:Uncharacterized protein n=1 Tax=Mortierella polycephala TaxID=41804 RepID=A0A9P6TVS1_9FUNG|nr:hypothetical protein BG011_009409 [Mortierella polycephala]